MKFGIHNVLRPFHLHIVFAIASRLAPCVPMNILNHCCRWTCQMLLNANHRLFSVPKIPAMKIEFMLQNLMHYQASYILFYVSIIYKFVNHFHTLYYQCKYFILFIYKYLLHSFQESVGSLTKSSFNTTTLSKFLTNKKS